MSEFDNDEKHESGNPAVTVINETNGHVAVDEYDENDESFIKSDRKLVSKIDWHLLPWICLLYALALIDRVNIGVARIAGMAIDIDLTGNHYNVALLVFFPGYFLFELPSNLMIRRFGTANWLAIIIICWGGIAIGMGFVHSWQLLSVCRALLGVFEAGFFPGCVYLISCWYKRYEVQTRLAIFYMSSVFASGFSAILAYGLSQIHTSSLDGWRWIFIVEGALTIFCAIIARFFIADFPQRATFLKPDEKARAVERLNKDRGDGEHDQITFEKIIKHLSDWKLWGFALIFFGTTAPCYALAYFAPVILLDMGFSVAVALLLIAPPYLLAVIVSLSTSYWADKVRHRTPFIFFHSIIAIIGFSLVASEIPNGVKLFGTFLAVAGSNPNQPAALAFAQNNIVGTSKRAVGSALQVMFGAIGGIAASTVFRDGDAPRYLPGLIATICFEIFAFSVAGLMALYFHKKNQQADKDGSLIEGTPGFRYTT